MSRSDSYGSMKRKAESDERARFRRESMPRTAHDCLPGDNLPAPAPRLSQSAAGWIPYKGYILVPFLRGSGYSVQRRSSATGVPFHVAYAATLESARKLVDEL